MKISYEGAKYSGWQRQGNTENTLQERIENVLSLMTGENIEVHGAGRTDAGVHARAQVASFRCESSFRPEEIREYCNRYLPKDIRVLECAEADGRFHARLNAKGKHYRYAVDTRDDYDVFTRRYASLIPGEYDLCAMKRAAKLLEGEHDFLAFCDNRHMKKSSVRRIDRIDISESEGRITFDFRGNGFLYHMVRIITGTLLEIGSGEREAESVTDILLSKNRAEAGALAPASGLTLFEVYY